MSLSFFKRESLGILQSSTPQFVGIMVAQYHFLNIGKVATAILQYIFPTPIHMKGGPCRPVEKREFKIDGWDGPILYGEMQLALFLRVP